MSGKINTDSQIVIVGGGIAGLFAASVLRAQGLSNITVIEKSDRVGGLLQSAEYENPLGDGDNYVFDYGTHFILKTGDSAVDGVIDQDLGDDYAEFSGSLPEGQYINGSFYPDSGCANATCFSADVLEKIKAEIEACIGQEGEANNLYDLLVQKYGETAVQEIYAPAFKKFSGQDLKYLDASLETSFNASRLIVADRVESKELKQDSAWDDCVAYAHYEDGTSPIKKYYPKEGGIQKWVEGMRARLDAEGVQILTSTSIESFQQEDGQIKSVTLSDGKNIASDFLIWTLPPIFLAKMLNIEVPSMPPSMRAVSIVNIITDKRPVEGPYWVTVYDPDILSYRLTLYNNFSSGDMQHKISVEVLHGGNFDGSDADRQKIFEELKVMNVLPDDAALLWSGHEIIPAGFPVLKPGDTEVYDRQNQILHDTLSNVHIVSRYRGGAHGQIAIMGNIYQAITERMESQEYDASYG